MSKKEPAIGIPARATTNSAHSSSLTAASGGDSAGFPIVGIGASAGGLAAFEAFFSGMPADRNPDMAFVLVQHLAPDHKSILTDLVKRYTRMRVSEVEDGISVQPNSVYIIPPNRDMAFINGTLQLLEPAFPRGQRLPIDFFFRSLAQDQHERAICIVLSGTGSDGTHGLREIKCEGGMAMAQTPESTEFDGMPRSAIATGLVDYVLPPAEMPARLLSYATHAFGQKTRSVSSGSPRKDDSLQKIALLLRAKTGHDFSLYKQNTVTRRVERRMAVHQIERMEEYISYLQQYPDEVDALFCDLLIGVTNFFRDPEAFAALANDGIPLLFANKPAGSTIRVWTCGCSTGEEAYSIAILLREQVETLKQNFKLQVFATDIDIRAIDQARSGIYPASIANDISPERLNRFFVRDTDGSSYKIDKEIREMLVFSKHDVIKDPPFSRIDLICCRNLLIYMGGELQKKLIPLFHYALNPDGILFLGTSESVGDFTDLFHPLDRHSKLYRKRGEVITNNRTELRRLQMPVNVSASALRHQGKVVGHPKPTPRELTERMLIRSYAPVAALVNRRGDIIYLHGRSGLYLELTPGDAGVNNILKTAREGLRHDLTTALHKAVIHNETVCRHGLKVKTNGDFTTVNLTVEPVAEIQDSCAEPGLFLVVLESAPKSVHQKRETPADSALATGITETVADDPRMGITALKQELQAKEEYLQSTIEELEASNEELKSSNEEMQSVNEELQSTNEELETSKEELQSVNEELATVNTELQSKVIELSQVNNDMNNLLAGTGVGTIFVDHKLRIQRFTPAATKVINLIRTDVGRPVGHIVSNLAEYNSLVEDVREVLDTLNTREIEVMAVNGDWYLLCIRPYRTLENVIEGAVITFTEITETIRSREALQRLAVVVNDSYDAITVQDLEGRILAWNPAAERMYGWSETEALSMNCGDRIPEQLREMVLNDIRQLSRAEILEPYHTQRLAKDGRIVNVWLSATALVNKSGQVYAISTTEREHAGNGKPRELCGS